LRYWRSEASASRQSTAERIRAPIGMASPLQTARIAAAIPFLMVRANNRHHRVRKVDLFENLRPNDGMDLKLFKLFWGKFPGFEMICSGTASLPMSCRTDAARKASVSSSVKPRSLASSTA